jgi:ABC-type glutathione transport system ATPase component
MATLLSVQRLSKTYVRGGLWRRRVPVAAAKEVNFEIRAGATLALVGASGSGKSTVARCVTRLERPDSGQIWIEGTEIVGLGSHDLLPFRSKIQMIFQDAVTSMNPRFSAAEVIEEPLLIQGRSRPERRNIAELLMKEVGLSPEWLKRRIMEFSGGQRQRLAIARALTVRPRLLVLDEALSGLDLSTQAQMTNLLLDLQATHSLSYLLISHDLAVVARMADTIAVMSDGRIVEAGTRHQIVADPKHSETKRLLASAIATESRLALSAGASA